MTEQSGSQAGQLRPGRRAAQKKTHFSSSRGMPVALGGPSVRPGPARRQAHPTLRRRAQLRLARIPAQLAAFRRSARMLSLLLLLGGALLLALFAEGDWFYVSAVQVDGNAVMSAADIADAAGVVNYNIFFVRFGELDRKLAALPALKSARAWYQWPNIVHVSVVERTPLVLWESGKHVSWIDETGQVFNALRQVSNVLTVSDLDNQAREQIDPQLAAALKSVQAALPRLRRMEYSDVKGLAFTDEHGWKVLLGRPDQLSAKLAVLQSLTGYLLAQKIDVEYVDVRLPDRAYYKPR